MRFSEEKLYEAINNIAFEGEFIKAEPYGSGHINDTFAVYFKKDVTP